MFHSCALIRFLGIYRYRSNHLRLIHEKWKGLACSSHLKWMHTTTVNCKKRKTAEEKKTPRMLQYPPKSKDEPIPVWKDMTVQDLADSLGKNLSHVFEVLQFVQTGSLYKKPNSVLSPEVVKEVVRKSGQRCKSVAPPQAGAEDRVIDEDAYPQPAAPPERLKPRPPVVAVMGHVDHGKTSLLDAIRNSRVVESEFGGITQHIGAFAVTLSSGDKITFLDTPGHAAFTAMRERGANATDIVVLVVAADDGVMEQTIESIRMANNAGVPIIVAINKIDKPAANISRTKKMLTQQGVQVEDAGGDIQVVPVSALTGENLDVLAEAIVLQAELMGLTADFEGDVEGVILESQTDPRRGKLSTTIVTRGTLRKGSILVAGTSWAKVRAMFDDEGRPMEKAPPSTAVQVIGWRDLPDVGEVALEVANERRANEVVRWRKQKILEKKIEVDKDAIKKKEEAHLTEYHAQLEAKRKLGKYKMRRTGPREKELKETDVGPRVNVILKGDVGGSVEAILDVIETYDCSEQCRLDVVHYGVGAVSENDVDLAAPFGAVIYAFNVDLPSAITQLAKQQNVTIKKHNVIYRLIDDLKGEISSKLVPKDVEDVIGEAKIQQKFMVSEGKAKVPVAGCRCVRGELKRDALFKVVRDGSIIFEGKLQSMRHLKNEVGTVKKDVECGIMFEEHGDFEAGDSIICFRMVPEPQVTTWDPGF